jgi:futalosine hydrolase
MFCMSARRILLLVPTELELAQLEGLGGFSASRAQVELCGFGPVAAAARAAELVARHSPVEVLLVGIAGSYDPARLPLGSAASFRAVAIEGIGTGFPQWPALPDRLALAPAGAGAAEVLLLTTCTASASPAQAQRRLERFPEAVAEDMEGFAVAFACALARVPCTIVRGISNAVGERDAERWRIPAALSAARTLALAHLAQGARA